MALVVVETTGGQSLKTMGFEAEWSRCRELAELWQAERQLAKLTGVTVQNISAMENGRRPIGKDMAKRFAKALNTDWRLLLS